WRPFKTTLPVPGTSRTRTTASFRLPVPLPLCSVLDSATYDSFVLSGRRPRRTGFFSDLPAALVDLFLAPAADPAERDFGGDFAAELAEAFPRRAEALGLAGAAALAALGRLEAVAPADRPPPVAAGAAPARPGRARRGDLVVLGAGAAGVSRLGSPSHFDN